MKQLIVALAVVILFLTFPLQYSQENINHYRRTQIDKYVKVAKEKAKANGYFTDENISELKTNILSVCNDLSESDITIDVDKIPKYRTNEFDDRELISYKIGVPVNKIVAANKFYGISDSDNKYVYYSDGKITSELIKPWRHL